MEQTPEGGAVEREWCLERDYDAKNGTHRLTNGRAQLSVWTGEVNDPDLKALEAQLNRGAAAAPRPEPHCGWCGAPMADHPTETCGGSGLDGTSMRVRAAPRPEPSELDPPPPPVHEETLTGRVVEEDVQPEEWEPSEGREAPPRRPTDAEIDDACMWYRHDYGLLTPDEQETVRSSAIDWLRAWIKVRDGESGATVHGRRYRPFRSE